MPGSHRPPCHKRMVITTQIQCFALLHCTAALQGKPVLYHSRWLLIVLWPWPYVHCTVPGP